MPLQNQSVAPCARWHRDFFVPVDGKCVDDNKRTQCLSRSQSWAANTYGRLSIMPGMRNKPAMKRRFSCPPLVSHGNFPELIQPITRTITLQTTLTPEKQTGKE